MGRSFRFSQTNSDPFSGLDGTVVFSDGTSTTDKILVMGVSGLGAPTLQTQTQKAPFQQGASLIRTLFQPRTITLECAISVPAASSTGLAEVTAIKRSVSHRLSPVGMGFLPQTSLSSSAYSTYLGLLEYASDGVTYDRFIDVVPMTVEFPNAYYKDGFQKMRVVFFCPDPFWYGAEQTATMSNVSVGISSEWGAVVWAEGIKLFCAVSLLGSAVQTSPDGITWTARTGTSASWAALAWSEELGLLCAGGNNGSIQTSPDGINWTSRTSASSAHITSIAWSPYLGLFCAVTSTSTVVQTSPDGINWTLRTGIAGGYNSITWSEELRIFCAVHQSAATLQTSPDGISWTSRTGAASGQWESITWSRELGLFCAVQFGTANIQTSPDGITWTLRTGASSGGWQSITWSGELGLFCAVKLGVSPLAQTSPDGITWTSRTTVTSANLTAITWSPSLGVFCAVSNASLEYPQISYDGINWVQNSATTDWYLVTANSGDVPADFSIDIPIKGGETGKVVAIGENFLWAGAGNPPSDHNIVFSTEGLKTGTVTLSTKFGSKTITQFNRSVLNKFVGGTFFSLYVSGNASNTLYLRNTGTPAGAPTITWRNRYIGV